MRLLAYTDAGGVGGAEISLANLLAALVDGTSAGGSVGGSAGDPPPQITVLGSSDEVVRRVTPPGVEAIVAPTRRHPQLLATLRPDLVHANLPAPWAAAPGLAAALALPRTRVLAVQQLPLRTVELPRWLRTRALLRRLDAHVAVGVASGRRIEDFYALGRGSVRSIPNYVPDVPADQRVDHATRTDDGEVVVGSLGRLDPMKGYDLLLDALARLPGTRLVVLGEGAQRSALEAQAVALGVADRVEFRGFDPDPRKHLAEWDVFCLPSRSEGFPLSVVEAMLAGLPVVATRVGSVGEAVQDGRTGLLVAKDDVEGLAAALTALIDRSRRQAMGRAGRDLAAGHFTVGRMADAYRALYRELLAAPRRPRLRPGPEKP